MELILKGRQVELTPALKSWVEKKTEKIKRKLSGIHKIEVELDYYPGKPSSRSECEITLYADHVIFRSAAENEDMYVAVDKAIEKILRQVEKYKGKVYASENKHNHDEKLALSTEKSAEPKKKVIKTKRFNLLPTTVNEAIEQMEYLSHDFFVFINSENGSVSVVYRRKDGNYGLIETDVNIQ